MPKELAMILDYGQISEAIPPAYTEYIGKYLMQAVEGK